AVLDTIREYTRRLGLALKVVGLMNVQYAIQRDTVYVLEVNPRASRTVPYVSKATAVPLAKVAARLMAGKKLAAMDLPVVKNNGVAEIAVREFYSVKSPVFPFNKFRGVDTILGPEMRSTGEVMGISTSYGQAFAKAQLAAGQRLPRKGTVFLSVNGRESFYDEKSIRRAAIRYNIPCITTLAAANAAARGIHALREQGIEVAALQDLHKGQAATSGAPASGD